MGESPILLQVILLLAVTAAGLAIFQRLKLPPIAGFLVTGAIAGPLIQDPERVREFAELGVVFLLFEIGLELPMDRVRKLWRSAALAGGLQMGVTTGLVAGGAIALGVSTIQAVVLGGLIAMSSTALVMRMLADRRQLDSPHGQLTVSVLVFQDLSIVPLLLAVPLLAGESSASGLDLLWATARAVIALGVVLLVVRMVVPRLLDRLAHLPSSDLFSLLALLIVLGSAALAQELGLTLAVGAFLAGMAASSSPYSNQLFTEVVPLRGVLIGIFFTAVGMLFDPATLLIHPIPVLAYLATTTLLKAAIIAVIAIVVLRQGARIGVIAGLTLAQTGEFSFVLAEVAREASILDEWLHQVVIAGSILSLMMTPFLIRVAPRIAEWVAGRVEHLGQGDHAADEDSRERVVIIGFGIGGQTLARLLKSRDIPYIVVDANAVGTQSALERGEPVLFGDATRPHLLQRIGISQARLVAIAISDALATRRIVSRIRAMAPETPILARARYVLEVDPLYLAGANVVVAEEFEGSLELVSQALELFDVPLASIRNFTDALREEGYGAIRAPAGVPIDPWVMELLDEVGSQWVTVPGVFPEAVTLAALNVRARTGATVMAVARAEANIPNPAPDFELRSHDRLLALGDPTAVARLDELLRHWAEREGS